MKFKVLSKRLMGNIDHKGPKLMMATVIIAVEVLMGVLCLVTGFHVFLLFFGGLLAVVIFLYPKIGVILMLFFMPGVDEVFLFSHIPWKRVGGVLLYLYIQF